MKIYTQKGDKGYTSIGSGEEISKDSIIIEAFGALDELIAQIGVARSLEEDKTINQKLLSLQKKLMTCFTLIIDIEKENKKPCTIKKEDTEKLEKEIDQYEAELPPLKTFLIPGERINSAYYNLTRTTCRKVERTMVKLSRQKHVPEDTLKYFNRLSDYFFLISRITDKNNKNDK